MSRSLSLLRPIAVSFTFATCCFLNTWMELAQGKSEYASRFDPFYAVAVPVIALEILIAATLLGIWEFARSRGISHWMLHAAFVIACLWPAGITAMALLRALPFDTGPLIRQRYFLPAALVLVSPVVVYSLLQPRRTGVLTRGVLAYSCFVAALIVFQASRVTLVKFPRSAYENGHLAKRRTSAQTRVRAVWIIFDEMSQTLAFARRPPGLAMPNLDHFRLVSLYSTSAHSPADATERSMPSLLLGETVVSIDPRTPDEWMVRTAGKPDSFPLSTAETIFDDAQKEGMNTAVAGWYLPYCRLINHSLTRCDWTAPQLMPGVEEPFQPLTLPDAMLERMSWQLTSLPLAGRVPALLPEVRFRDEKRKRFIFLLDCARKAAADASIGLALIHLPVPHPPSIYSRSQKTFARAGALSYVDSLALADWTFGELRRAMENAGVWDRTAVIVSADHGWRTTLWSGKPDWTQEEEALAAAGDIDRLSVPFLVKMPYQAQGLKYDQEFNTVVTRHLIADILGGRVTRPEEVPAALNQ